MTALADAYERDGRFYVGTMSRTDTGLWIATGVNVVDGDATETALGRVVRAALAASKTNVPHPSRQEINHVADPLLHLAGVRSFRKFQQGARLVTVEQDGQETRLTPMKNGWPKPGFEYMPDKVTALSQLDDYGLGVALLAALEQAE